MRTSPLDVLDRPAVSLIVGGGGAAALLTAPGVSAGVDIVGSGEREANNGESMMMRMTKKLEIPGG